jgi:hypothetical protein
MSFSHSTSFGSSKPLQPVEKHLYPSFNAQTPVTPSPSIQQKPPPRPASVPLSFGGGLPRSTSTPLLSQAFQQNHTTEQPQQPGTFSPSPQPPLTTYDLAGNSPSVKPPLQWGQQLGGQGLTRSHSQQFMPQGMGNPLGERRYLPSHLRVFPPSE